MSTLLLAAMFAPAWAQDAHTHEVPAQYASVQDAPAQEAPAPEAPAQEASAPEASAQVAPAPEAPAPAPEPVRRSDLATSLWHPGAGGMERGFSYVGTTVIGAAGPDYAGTWVGATGAWAPSKRLSFSGTGLAAVGSTVVAGGVRFNVVESKWFRAGAVGFAAGWKHDEQVSSHGAGAGLGVAVEGGFTRVRFDTFVPLLVTTSGEGPLEMADRLPGFNAWDVGMTIRMGSSHANRLRGALGSGGGSFAYQHVGEHWFMETALSVGDTPTVSGWLRGGWVF